MKRGITISIILAVILIVGGLIYYSITRTTPDLTATEKEQLAKCLTEKGIFLYGSIDCPNCEVQKEKFGEAVQYLTYINCYIYEDKCVNYSKQKVYPFWGMGETVIVGPIPLDKLKQKTGC